MNTDDPKNDPSQSQPNVSDPAQVTGNDPSLVDLVDALPNLIKFSFFFLLQLLILEP